MFGNSGLFILAYIISFSINSIVSVELNKNDTNFESKNKFDTKFSNFADNKTKESLGANVAYNNQYIVADNSSNNNGYIPVVTAQNSDPLIGSQQNANPFLAGAPGVRNNHNNARKNENEIDPRLALILQNSPRLQLLARQNPILAQRILRNPGLLQDPRIAAVIRSQLRQGGGGLGLLPGLGSFLPGGALSPLTPLGIGLGGAGQRRGFGQNNNNNNNHNNNGLPNAGTGNGNPGFGGVGSRGFGIGLPRQNPSHRNEENIGGGYYGNNGNYGQSNANPNDSKNNEVNTDDNENENNEDQNAGNNEEDENQSGQEGDGQEGQEEGGEDQDQNQNPAEDPDIKQLQELGGSGDNFPEGLFPPGLLSKEDIAEIRKQQEKQAREQTEKEKRQQQNDNQGQDYDGEGEGGAEGGDDEEAAEEGNEGASEENTDNETPKKEEPQTTQTGGYVPQNIPTQPPAFTPQPNLQHNNARNGAHRKYSPSDFGGQKQPSVPNPGVQYDDEIEPVVTQPRKKLSNNKNNNNYVNVRQPKLIPSVQYRPQGYQIPINPRNHFNNNQPQHVTAYPQPINPQYHQQQQQQHQQQQPPQQPFYPPQQQQYPQQYPQQYSPQQYIPQQHQQQPYQPQYIQPNQQQYPQQFIPQQPNVQQYPNQQQHYSNQPNYSYQQYPQQQYPQQQQQHQHLQPQPVYPQYQSNQPIVPNSTPIQTRRQIYSNVVNQQQLITPPPQQLYTTPDPNIANHNLNNVPEDEGENEYNDNNAEEETEDGSQEGDEGEEVNTTELPNFANNGQTFQQHPRIFSPVYTATASSQSQPSVSVNAANQTVSSQNVKQSLRKQY